MERDDFFNGLKVHFGVDKKQAVKFIDKLIWLSKRTYSLNLFEFDDYLHEKFGEYEDERKMSMADIIEAKYGEAAKNWAEKAITSF